MRTPGTTTRWLLLAGSAGILTACSILAPSSLNLAAQQARVYPFVIDTYWHEGGWGEREFIEIVIKDGTTQEQADELWCGVLVPKGADDDNALVYNPEDTLSYSKPECTRG